MLQSILRPLFALVLAGGAVAFVACDDDPDPEEARVAVCEDYAAMQQAQADWDSLDDSNTFDDYEAAADRWNEAADNLADSAEDYLDANDELVEDYVNALEALDDALGNLDSSMTVGEARAAVQDE